jgi:hypothetical protein
MGISGRRSIVNTFTRERQDAPPYPALKIIPDRETGRI